MNILLIDSYNLKLSKKLNLEIIDNKYFKLYDKINDIHYGVIEKPKPITDYNFITIPIGSIRYGIGLNWNIGYIIICGEMIYKWIYEDSHIAVNYNFFDKFDNRQDINIFTKNIVPYNALQDNKEGSSLSSSE